MAVNENFIVGMQIFLKEEQLTLFFRLPIDYINNTENSFSGKLSAAYNQIINMISEEEHDTF